RDDRADRNPRVIADLDWRNERILDAGPDVAPDLRPPLRPAGLVRVVSRDRAGTDVRLGADLGVAGVGQVRHLCPCSDPGVLELDERARLRAAFQRGSGAKVTERAYQCALADLGVDRDDVGADLGPAAHAGASAEHGERMD